MANDNQSESILTSRSEIVFANHRESDKTACCHSRTKICRPTGSTYLKTPNLRGSTFCSYCKTPLCIDVSMRGKSNKSRVSAALEPEKVCVECNQERAKTARVQTSRLNRSASINWSNMNNKIESWFEKAKTPEQRVVYNFLEKINNEKDSRASKSPEKIEPKNLDDVLLNLKKYYTRFNSAQTRNKLSRTFESSSWRVLRHPSTPYSFTRYDPNYGNQATRDLCVGSVFAPTNRRMGSTFLIHPDWV